MKKSLTEKQKLALATITDFMRKHGKSPTLKELKSELKLKAMSSVQRHLDALKEKGYLQAEKYQQRGMRVHNEAEAYVSIPLVGNVAAGTPLLAEENIVAYVSYPKAQLRSNESEYFFLRAVGDSMNKTNVNGKTIDNGDFVLIKKQQSADPGSRIVALLGDEATIKRFKHENGAVVLKPESTNPQNKPIYLFENFMIQGIVKDVLKKGGV